MSVEVKKSQHRYVIGPKGSGLTEILAATGVSVEIPPLDNVSETITLRGDPDKLGPALTMVYAKVCLTAVVVIQLGLRVHPGHGKSWNLGRPYSRPGNSWKIAKVMEKSWKMMIMSWNFYYCAEEFCKSDTTSFIKSNYEP